MEMPDIVQTRPTVQLRVPGIPLNIRNDSSGIRWIGESPNADQSIQPPNMEDRSRRKVGCGDGNDGRSLRRTDESEEMKEIRRFSEDENYSYETCLTARSHPSDVKEL